MQTYKIKKGYDVPVRGEAQREIVNAPVSPIVGIYPADYHGIVPRLKVAVGDRVKQGGALFFDKKNPDLVVASPVSGMVRSLAYGPRRKLGAIYILPDGNDVEQFESYRPSDIPAIERDYLVRLLMRSGLWPFLRQRPFDKIADPAARISSIFINCMDTAPLAADPEFALKDRLPEFKAGVEALKILCPTIHVVVNGKVKSSIFADTPGVNVHAFNGRHPAGLVSTHISKIDPVHSKKKVYYLNARDAVMIGQFLLTGQYNAERVVAVAGEGATDRRYFRTHIGAWLVELIGTNVTAGEMRFINGNLLTGKAVDRFGFVGAYNDLVTVIPEGRERHFLGWLMPGFSYPSFSRAFVSAFLPRRSFQYNTSLNGEHRALVKTGDYEKVVALDVLPDQLVRAILVEDLDMMEQLGLLECAPEDFALCSYICVSKTDFCGIVEQGLELLEKEL
ncbi:MAG: Na(+)-translocating NADH-quinone reductase subunit A [Spirochaetales bacterium]|nr:Na(+)-translocating NADH-quinone reductase subunit A [Spirochaetales bacterium]